MNRSQKQTVGRDRLPFLIFWWKKIWLKLLIAALCLETINRLVVEHSWGTRCPLAVRLSLSIDRAKAS
ncbi:MAG: hypothetical protein CMM05_06455 [Rhodopirellula sp.]|nr:hypothetical protein [Rhodopirellula sp.]